LIKWLKNGLRTGKQDTLGYEDTVKNA